MDDTAATPPEASADPTPAEHEAARLRGPRRLLVVGSVASLLGAVGSGLLGADGRAGFFVLLLLLAATFGLTGLWIGLQLLVDEFRGAPTSPRRGLLVAGMFVATLVCMTAVGGVASGMEATA